VLAVVVVVVTDAVLAVGQAVRSNNTVLAVLQQQKRRWRRRRSAAAKVVAHARWRAGQDHRSAVVDCGVRGRRPPTSTATAATTTTATAATTATTTTTGHLRQRGAHRRWPVRPGVSAPGHHWVRPRIAGPTVDHLRDGRGRDRGRCRCSRRKKISADFQKGRSARTHCQSISSRRTDATAAADTVVRLQPEEGELLAGTVRTACVLAHQEGLVPATAYPPPIDRLAGGRRTATAARTQTEPVHVGHLRHAAATRRPPTTAPAAAATTAAAEPVVATATAVAVAAAPPPALPTVRQRVG